MKSGWSFETETSQILNWRPAHTQWLIEGCLVCSKTPFPPKFQRPPQNILPNSTRLWKLFKIAEFRAPKLHDVRKRSSKILKLPPLRNYFTLAMTNKLFVIINSLKMPKIKKILLYKMKCLVQNYSCLQNTWLGRLPSPDPRSFCPLFSTEFVEPPRTNSCVRHFAHVTVPSGSNHISVVPKLPAALCVAVTVTAFILSVLSSVLN